MDLSETKDGGTSEMADNYDGDGDGDGDDDDDDDDDNDTSTDKEKYEDVPSTISLPRIDNHPNGPITSSLKHLDTFGLILAQFAPTHPPKPMQASMQGESGSPILLKRKLGKLKVGKGSAFMKAVSRFLCKRCAMVSVSWTWKILKKRGTANVFAESLVFGHLLIHHVQ